MAKKAAKSAKTAEIAGHGYVLRPGRYVGAEEVENDGEPFEEKMSRLVAVWRWQMGLMGRMGPMRRVFSDARSHQPPLPAAIPHWSTFTINSSGSPSATFGNGCTYSHSRVYLS